MFSRDHCLWVLGGLCLFSIIFLVILFFQVLFHSDVYNDSVCTWVFLICHLYLFLCFCCFSSHSNLDDSSFTSSIFCLSCVNSWISYLWFYSIKAYVLLYIYVYMYVCVCAYIHMYICMCMCARLCLTLCNLMDYSQPGSSVHGIYQVRTL